MAHRFGVDGRGSQSIKGTEYGRGVREYGLSDLLFNISIHRMWKLPAR